MLYKAFTLSVYIRGYFSKARYAYVLQKLHFMDFPYTFIGILDRDSVPHTHGESPEYNTFFIRMIGN